MTSSRSKASINSRLARFACVVLVAVFCAPSLAHAEKRKRVVVLELDGPKAEKFHDDLVRLIKKSHTVIPVDKWNGTAEELDATKLTDKDIKKVAKKLKIDAVVTGKIEKRRDEYLVKLKLRAGKTGELVGEGIDTKAEGPRLDGKASKDLKDELMDALDSLQSNRGGSSSDDEEADEDKPVKKGSSKKTSDDEEDEDKPVKKGFSKKSSSDDEEEADKPVAKKAPAKKSSSEDEEEDSPLPKSKKRPAKASDDEEDGEKKTASKDGGDEEDGVEASGDGGEPLESALALSPGERAVDAVLGLSLNARRLSFKSAGAVTGYKGVPVAGVLLDGTIYPLAIGHKKKGMLKNLGLTLMYDKVIKINSKSMGMSLPTTEARYAFGAVFRYPFGSAANSPVIGASVRYGRQNFTIKGTTELPNVNYSIVDPTVFFKYPVNGKIILDASLGVMAVLNTGAIQKMDQYGAASVLGFEGEFGGDYALTKNIFARAAFKFETIGFTFKGTGAKAMANMVTGARDNYLGGAVTVGYLY